MPIRMRLSPCSTIYACKYTWQHAELEDMGLDTAKDWQYLHTYLPKVVAGDKMHIGCLWVCIGFLVCVLIGLIGVNR